MEITFTYQGYPGRVVASVERTMDPASLGGDEGAMGLANCTATIEFAGRGYLQLLGWVQLVRSTDNSFQGREFEMDPGVAYSLSSGMLSGVGLCEDEVRHGLIEKQ